MSEKRFIGTRNAYGEFLKEIGKENPNVVALDADLSCSTQTCKFYDEYPERFFNIGISEQNLVGTAAGLAAYGKKPFISTFAVFASGRAWEPIRQSLCVPKLPVNIIATHGGVTVGADGGSHQMTEDFAIMRALPNMIVLCPADGYETKAMLRRLVEYNDGPAYVRLSRIKFPVIYDDNYKFEIGKSDTLRDGKDITIIAVGYMVHAALEAAEQLAVDGIDARVINMASLKPIDEEAIIKAARETRRIVTIEEHQIYGGLGSAVAQVVAENHPVPMRIMGVHDKFGLSGEADQLLEYHGLTSSGIVEKVKSLL
ncbi:MAG: transketolase family protein [Acidobacteria bacterium]|nr:transketolase family protein [Acidobacteriota bacterium]